MPCNAAPGTSVGEPRSSSSATCSNASLPLSVLSRHISWMTPKEAEDGLRMLAAGHGSRGLAPRSRWRPRPLIEISEKALRREPSAGRSEGRVVTEVWRCQWIEPG